ncbi:hypothetical protein Q3W73_02785 [Klebsiella pneumoniae]|uniref:hypothetical protein n=1 Tax=Klebsiella pneumoniae TaxID=573 RepID=UPI002E15506D|nr:hypothetical protein Q3W73_02785 [Klebsiella pneumoniae]
MNIKEIGNVFHCDCGFSWHRGKNGNHNCADGLREKVRQLAAENVALKRVPETDSVAMLLALNSFRSELLPDVGLQKAFESLMYHRMTPATDAYLAGIKADGVEEFVSNTVHKIFDESEAVSALAYLSLANSHVKKLREGADK